MSKERHRRTLPVTVSLAILLLVGGAAYGDDRSAAAPPTQTWQGRLESTGISTPTDLVPTPSPDEVDQVSEELYCPLCTGVRVDNCDLPLCDQMREVIHQKLAQGETKEEIKAYFVEQYGDIVLGVPPKRGGMVLAWVLPILVVLAAGLCVAVLVRRRTRQWAMGEMEATEPQSLPPEYAERLERELEQFD